MNSKPDLRVVVMEGMAMVPKILHTSFTDGATSMYPLFPYAYLLMPTAG